MLFIYQYSNRTVPFTGGDRARFFGLVCFIFATSLGLLSESLARPQEKRRDKGTVRFLYKKKLSLSLVLVMLLKFISFSMFFRLTFFCVVAGRL